MYAGRAVEQAPVRALFREPAHPYTRGLLDSLPRPGRRGRLSQIAGQVPGIFELPPGCRFHPRCPEAIERCAREEPELFGLADGRTARCWLHESAARAPEGTA
jgi:oligopeptide/dipeptide ABC transporter ATP-binding protein